MLSIISIESHVTIFQFQGHPVYQDETKASN